MRYNVRIQMILFTLLFVSLPFFLMSQAEGKNVRKVRIKTVKEGNGKKIVKDTTFIITGDGDVNQMLENYTADETDSTGNIFVNVSVDTDEDDTGHIEKKIVVIKKGDGDEHVRMIKVDSGMVSVFKREEANKPMHSVMRFNTDDSNVVFVVVPNNKYKNLHWKSNDGKSYEYEFDLDQDDLNEQMQELAQQLQGLEQLKDLESLDQLKDLDLDFDYAPLPPEHHHDYRFKDTHSNRVTDVELRDAGIKQKPDRLDPENMNVDNDDGMVHLSFSLHQEGNPRVIVYNVYGDKVYNGTPQFNDGGFETTIDLSQKQHGTYYLMIILKNSSKTIRLHN